MPLGADEGGCLKAFKGGVAGRAPRSALSASAQRLSCRGVGSLGPCLQSPAELRCSFGHSLWRLDDDDNGFGVTVRCAPVVTKVRYRKKNLVKKNEN